MYKAETISKCYDTLVIGSGIAGLLLADLLADKGMSVLLACKGKLADSNTSMAQGGLAAVTGANPVDSPDLHLKDTLSSGAGLTDAAIARMIVARGSDLVKLLDDYGVKFDKTNGVSNVALEGGHSRARVLHSKDASGRAISTGLIDSLRVNINVTIWEDAFALDLLVADGICGGAVILIKGIPIAVRARHTVLATGGAGQVFSRTTNPEVATADGIAMAFRGGARVVDMEFMQFHPTALSVPGKPAFLISEAVRGAGATLLDSKGERFAFRFHKDGELATRDIVARGIYTTMMEQNTGAVNLDLRPIGVDVTERFPNIFKKCMEFGIDPRLTPIPIAPAAHYFMGGIWTDQSGATSVPGLYAIGECASIGLHGANRLASNSLLEGGVMAMQLAQTLGSRTTTSITGAPAVIIDAPIEAQHAMPLAEFRAATFRSIGLERNEEKLSEITELFAEAPAHKVVPKRAAAEHSNIELVGWLMANSALQRKESRGAHWRSDFPRIDDLNFSKRRFISTQESSWLEVQQPHAVPLFSELPV